MRTRINREMFYFMVILYTHATLGLGLGRFFFFFFFLFFFFLSSSSETPQQAQTMLVVGRIHVTSPASV